jgi:hypothetical protein
MLAIVAHHEPAVQARLVGLPFRGSKIAWRLDRELLNELHMAPGCRRQFIRVVVAVAGPVKAIRRQLIPLLARYLARLAADANRGVGVKAGGRTRLRRLATQERIDQASHQLRQPAAWRIAGLRQRCEFHFPTCHVRFSLRVEHWPVCLESGRESAKARSAPLVTRPRLRAAQPGLGRRTPCFRACSHSGRPRER